MATLETDIAADAPGNDVALTFGDIISLMSLSPRSHVTAAGLIDDHVYAEALVAGVKMPPNPRDCRFILKPASNLSEATALRALISRGELQDGDEVTHLKERVALEASHNQLELNRLWGTEVRYGDAIELEHVTSKKYLATCDDQHDGHVSMLGGAALQLETPNEAGLDAHAKLIPAFASHVEGSVICSGHAVILHFTNRGLGFSVPARQAFGGDSPENDALHPHVRERTVVRAQVRPTRLMLIKLCAASAVATNRSLVHGCAAVQLVFNSTREELSVATNDGNEDESAAFGTRLNGNVIKQAVQDEDGDTSYLPSFRKGAPPGLGANSMCWWVLEPTEMFGSCEPAKLGKHRKYRLKHLVTGVYLSASASEGASSDTDSLEALPSFSHDVHGQTLWHLLMMLPEMHSDSGTALLRAGATVFIKSASTGRLICASTNLSSFSDTASVPRMVSHGQGTSESTASFSVRIGSDDEMNQILWARNCQRRLSKFYQLIKQHQTRTKRKSSVIDEPGVALESRFIGMHRQSSSKRRSSVTRLVRNSPSTSKRDMSLSDDGQNDPMLRSLLSRYNEEVEATLSELTIRCTSCDELDPIGRSINGTPVRAVQTLLHEQGTNALVVRLLCALLELSFSHTADIQRVQRIAALCVAMLRCAIRSYPPAQAVVAQHETQLMGHLYAARTETVLMEACVRFCLCFVCRYDDKRCPTITPNPPCKNRYRDNNQLLRAAKLSLPRTFTNAIRKQRKLPEYLLFLQSLCSCYGVPLATTQNMVADALLARPDALAKDSQVTLRVPSQTEVLELWGPTVQSEGGVYYKTTKVHARIALKDGELETVVDGHVETHNKYKKGDFIMCGSRGGQYPMTSENFKKRYEHNHPEPANTEELAEEGFERYRPIGQIWAHTLSTVEVNEHFPARQFMGKWGSPVSVEPGDALAMPFPKGGEVYLIRKSLLSSSYALSEKSNHSKPLRRSSVCIGSPGGNKRKSLLHTELDASGVAKGVFLELKLEEQRGQHQSEGTNVSIRDPDDENDSEWHSMHQFCGPVGMAMASMDMGARATAVRLLRYLCGTYELLAHLCAGRNRRVCDTLLAELVCKRLGTDLKTLSSLVASRCVPHVLRAAAVSLLHALYIDREPHEQRDPIALTRCWGAVDAAAVRGAAAARAAARGVAGTLPQSAVDEAKRQAAKSLLISTEKGHGLNVRFVVVDPFAEFTHIGKVNPSFILDALIGTLESLVPELASDFAAAAASGNKTPRKSSTKNGLVGRKRSQPLERKESSLLLSTNRRTSDGAKLMTSLLKLTETIVRFGCAHLHQLRKLLSPTLGLLAAFGPADRHNDSAVNNKLSSQTATRELSNDSAERCKMLLTGLSVLTLLLDSQLDERLARFQHEYETKGCADFAALLKHPERIELQEHGIAPFTDSHAEQLAQELFDEPILAPELIAAPRTGDETIEIVDKSRNRRRSRALLEPSDAPASNVAPDGVPGPAASMILLGLTRCEDPGVRTLSLELLLRLLSQREAFIARLRQVTYITDDAGATSLRELGYATSELRRLRKWVASDDAQRRKDAVCSARRIVIALTEEMRPNSDRPQSERAHKREMVRHSGCLDHVISLLQIPLELERDDDESDSEEPASPTPAQNQNQTSNESAFPASRSSSRSLSRSLNEPKQNRPEKKPDGVLPLPKAADDDHLALTQACLRFIEEYCSAGIAFQVTNHSSLTLRLKILFMFCHMTLDCPPPPSHWSAHHDQPA